MLADTFTDTDNTLLAAYDPDTGDAGSWVEMDFHLSADGSISGDQVILDNHTRPDTGNSPIHRNDTDPGGDEYDVEATLSFSAAGSNRFSWITVRMSPTGTAHAAVDRYTVLFLNGADPGTLRIDRSVSGTYTSFVADASFSFASQTFACRIEVRDGSLEVFLNDVSVVSTTDTSITQRGRVGLGGRTGLADQWIDDLTVTAVGTGVTGTLAVTEQDDSLAAAGTVTPPTFTGTLAVTEQDDTLAAAGAVTNPTITGTVSFTEADDTLAAAGAVTVPTSTGTLAVTEAADTLAAAGTFSPGQRTGSLAVTEADDTLAASGTGTGATPGVLVATAPTAALVATAPTANLQGG